MVEIKDLLISVLIGGFLLTVLVNLLFEGNILNDKTFSEDFSALNKTFEVLGNINDTGTSIQTEETQRSDFGFFSLKGGWKSLKNSIKTIGIFGHFINGALSILHAPTSVFQLVSGIIGAVITYKIFGRIIGGSI